MPGPMEKAAGKAAAAAKAAKSHIKGLGGIFTRLMKEHGEVSTLMLRLRASDDPDDRARLFPTIYTELLAHERAETEELFPVLRQYEETSEIANQHDAESEELETLLDELQAIPFDDPEWKDRFAELVSTVQHHVEEEEQTFFPTANEVLGDRATALEGPYEQARTRFKEQLLASAAE